MEISPEDTRLAMEQKSNGRAVIAVICSLGSFAFAGLLVIWNLTTQLVPQKISNTPVQTTTLQSSTQKSDTGIVKPATTKAPAATITNTKTPMTNPSITNTPAAPITNTPTSTTVTDTSPAPTNATLQSVITALIALISTAVGALGSMLASTRSGPQPTAPATTGGGHV